MSERARVRILVAGRVQGVGFRWGVGRRARSLGVFGWARNLGDGRVEVVLEGEARAVQLGLEYVRNGPPGALVVESELFWEEPEGALAAFSVR